MESTWQSLIPDSILFDIFSYLDIKTLGRAAQVCTTWQRIANDEMLWQQLARRTWKIKGGLAPGKTSWYGEVKRLTYHVPVTCSETIEKHTDEVLDVSISHSGQYFCTCSKDALVIMWELGNTRHSSIVKSFDASIFLKWQLPQYSTFCPDDSLILVCGVKSNDELPVDEAEYKAGVGAVFTVPDLNVVSVVEMDPPTMFGAWLNERVFLGCWPGTRSNAVEIQAYMVQEHHISLPVLAPKACAVILPEDYRNLTDISYDRNGYRLFSFLGNRYHLMNLLVANVPVSQCCLSGSCDMSGSCDISVSCDTKAGKQRRKRTSPFDESFEVPKARKVKIKDSKNRTDFSDGVMVKDSKNRTDFLDGVKIKDSKNRTDFSDSVTGNNEMKTDSSDSNVSVDRSCDILAAECSPYIGSKQSVLQVEESSSSSLESCTSYGTHRLENNSGCKPCSSSKYVDTENEKGSDKNANELSGSRLHRCSNKEGISKTSTAKYKQYVSFVTGNHDVIAVHEVTPEHLKRIFKDKENQIQENETMEDRLPGIDKIDHRFHLKDCYITGLCLSHDQRFLYFNFREMDMDAPENKVDEIGDELPVAEKVFCKDLKIGSIDLVAMEMVKDIVFSGHVGYSTFPAWYIGLDACLDYIGSGSEDMRGYIWDRHYGVCIGRLFHSSVDTGDNTLLVMSLHENSVVNGLAFSPVDQETCITVCDDRLIKVWRSKHKMKSQLESDKRHRIYKDFKMNLMKKRNLQHRAEVFGINHC